MPDLTGLKRIVQLDVAATINYDSSLGKTQPKRARVATNGKQHPICFDAS